MGIPVLVLGESGSGKSASLREFKDDEIGIFNVAGKPLPFRKKIPKVDNARYPTILKGLDFSDAEKTKTKLKRYVIDDSQYLMAFAMFDRAKENGYGKFTDVALDFRNLIDHVITKTPEDLIVYFLHHVERSDDGRIKAKTSGKMLDTQLTVEGLFSIVLLCVAEGETHKFITQSDGTNTAKSPMKMFDREIDNDLKKVDDAIREYWDLNK